MIKRLWNNWQTKRVYNILYYWNGYDKLPFDGQMVINQALDILRKAQEK